MLILVKTPGGRTLVNLSVRDINKIRIINLERKLKIRIGIKIGETISLGKILRKR